MLSSERNAFRVPATSSAINQLKGTRREPWEVFCQSARSLVLQFWSRMASSAWAPVEARHPTPMLTAANTDFIVISSILRGLANVVVRTSGQGQYLFQFALAHCSAAVIQAGSCLAA
ncbi:hypothetical protein D3C85_1550870 [compost metagenome]